MQTETPPTLAGRPQLQICMSKVSNKQGWRGSFLVVSRVGATGAAQRADITGGREPTGRVRYFVGCLECDADPGPTLGRKFKHPKRSHDRQAEALGFGARFQVI